MKKFIYFILVIMMLSVVYGANPHTQTVSTTGLQIISSTQETYKLMDDNLTIFFHIYNSTNYLLTADKTTCRAHIYNSSFNNQHILENYIIPNDNNNIDKELVINRSLLNEGTYTFRVNCNSSTEAGFYEQDYDFNFTGYDFNEFNGLFFILGIIGTVLIMLIIAFKLNEEHKVIKFIMIFFSIYITFIIPFYLLDTVISASTLMFYRIYIIFLWIMIAYVFLYFCIKLFTYLSKAWRNKGRGFNFK